MVKFAQIPVDGHPPHASDVLRRHLDRERHSPYHPTLTVDCTLPELLELEVDAIKHRMSSFEHEAQR